MTKRMALTIAVTSALAFIGGCGDGSIDDDPGLPNPAAVFCEEQGGTVSGPEPMCELPDGSVVDAWEYFRAGNPGS